MPGIMTKALLPGPRDSASAAKACNPDRVPATAYWRPSML